MALISLRVPDDVAASFSALAQVRRFDCRAGGFLDASDWFARGERRQMAV